MFNNPPACFVWHEWNRWVDRTGLDRSDNPPPQPTALLVLLLYKWICLDIHHPDRTGLWFSFCHPPRCPPHSHTLPSCSVKVSSDLFPETLWVFLEGGHISSVVFGILIKPAFYPLLHPPWPLNASSPLCYALFLLLLLFSFSPFPTSPPSFISPFSWTPTMRYSVYRHRYGRLSLLTVSTPNAPHPPVHFPGSILTSATGRRTVCCSVGCALLLLSNLQ